MSDMVKKLFNDFDRGLISRRHLLQVLGVAAVARPAMAFAQGSCGGANAGTPRCNTTPGKAPFAPTGWNTVLLDHFTVQVADLEKEIAYYEALMNWKIRSNDGKVAMLDIGTWGGLKVIGGYQPPAPATPPPAAAAAPPAAAAGDPAAAARAGGAGGRGGAGGGGARQPARQKFTGFCWGIDKWNAKTVEAELKKRGLNPIADNDPKNNFESFHVIDPGGFDLQISNGNTKNRRQGPATGKAGVAAPFAPTNWKTVWLDHISFQVADYKANVAFYEALLGWKPREDEGSQNEVAIGDVGDAIIRGGNALDPNFGRGPAAADGTPGPVRPPQPTSIGHISFGISPWDSDAVGAELDKRGLNARVDTGGNGSTREQQKTAKYQSYHTTTPNGFDLQISMVTKATRGS